MMKPDSAEQKFIRFTPQNHLFTITSQDEIATKKGFRLQNVRKKR